MATTMTTMSWRAALSLLLLVVLLAQRADADIPIARDLLYHVAPGTEQVITLKGFNRDGSALSATITSLPQNGQLYQLSQVFSAYGYDPKKDVTPITAVPTAVTGSKNRVVFVRADYGGPPLHTKYAEFRYTLTNGVDVSKSALITITANEALVTSTFDRDIEDWGIVSNGNSGRLPRYQPISRGSLLSYYIYGIDAVIHRKNDAAGDDAMLWYFSAPDKFLGNQWSAYGGSLDFVLSSAEGSFSADNLNLFGRGNLVQLECSTCSMNAGITLAMPLSPVFTYDGATTQFRLPLNELAGWLKDPKNVILPWLQPSQCEFVNVLSALTSVRILGDFTRGYESVALDTVSFRHGPGKPLRCYTNSV